MKATGIVRRIDDLGRVVVPKEIRRTLRIREGDPLEIFTDREGEIILKKYSPIGELGQFAKQYADSLAQTTGHIVAITDKDQFIAVAGPTKKDLLMKGISHELEEVINERETVVAARDDKNYVRIMNEDESEFVFEAITPIISEGDAIGSVIFLTKDAKTKFGELEIKLAATAAAFMGRQMEQ
jgi:AbrB family transcriptional regulator, stage V sporulation protein T